MAAKQNFGEIARASSIIALEALAPAASSASSALVEPAATAAQGLQVVCEDTNPVIDIIAVHGLNGHCEKTWTADNGVNWLCNLLPLTCPTRTYSAGATTQIRTATLALGGIIVKSSLIHSDAARRGALEEHRSIKLSTYGIMFMGTPHQGGGGVALGKLMVNVAAGARLLQHLEWDSEWQQQQLGQYGPISGDFVTKFAVVEYATPTVVPKASAVVPGAADGEPIAIHADHIHMVKFGWKSDPGYRTVSGHLRVLARRAGNAVSGR
ncbi:hypothetical protein CC86DRAFT_411722 [Ophiobolus disseminans]|uniref:Uncharacterized protein n=1 Tax=Ophiobolus disseminans TaxID=1469910 RepID=A0A6A6ZKX3_9PLEO|nr:hypothetical protein CC86DRAFT_411722 [Ophiobolus disseminans]